MGESKGNSATKYKSQNPASAYRILKRSLRILFILVIILLPFALTGFVEAKSIEVSIESGIDDLAFSRINGYDLVEVSGNKCSLHGKPGEPWLPVRDVHILLPPGAKVSEVKAETIEEIEIDGVYYIHPTQKDVVISSEKPPVFIAPNARAYNSFSTIPGGVAALLDTIIIRGYHIAVVRIYPVAYVPATGKLALRSRIKLTIILDDKKAKPAMSYKSPEPLFKKFVAQDVVNAEDLKAEYQFEALDDPLDGEDVKYLLIGDSSMFDEFQPLLDWKTRKGVPAEAVSVDWIYSNYSGADNQTKIKACIKDYVQNKGTVWVVLAGDDTIVPDRDCYGNVNSGADTDTTIPTDLYYAGLDDMDWNDDGDDKAGEVGDDTIDMGPDVYVGRFPIRTEAHATAIVNKTLFYEKNCPASGFVEKMILCGDQLWDPGDAEGKSEYMYTYWIDPNWEPVRYRFYDTNTDFPGGENYDLSPTNMDEQIVNGYNFLHMATHGSQTSWGMETGGGYYSSRALSVNNTDKYTNILTIACSTNAFENGKYTSDPCLSEGFIRNPDGGAATYIGSSRYGWGVGGLTTHGSSFKYDRMFYQFLFTGDPSTHPQQVGSVYTRMKEYWIGSCTSYGSMRWCQFAVNLMGDPELPLYTAEPSTFSPSYQGVIFSGSDAQTFVVETGVSGAKVCLLKEGISDYEVYAYGNADATGHFETSITPTTEGTLHVTITALNCYPYEGTTSVLLGPDGNVYINEDYCTDNDVLHVIVGDSDLKGNGTQDVALDTSIGGDFETLTLSETGPLSGIFEGTIQTTSGFMVEENGTLEVLDGETITVHYTDADDGNGNFNVNKTDTAEVDAAAPIFAGLVSAEAGDGKVTLTWDAASDPRTPITYNIYRAESSGGQDFNNPLDSVYDLSYIDTTVINGTIYFYVVRAVDSLGNEDDNVIEKIAFPTGPVPIYQFLLDSDPGWTTEADWAFGQPTGDGGEYGGPDPTSGYTGSNVYGYNLAGDYPNNLSPTQYLTTTAIDCRDHNDIKLRFRRWLGVEIPTYDHAYIEVSNDGTNWEIIWENSTAFAEISWSLQEYDISSLADNQDTVYIRWGMGTTDSSWQYCGWNIDDIEILAIQTDYDDDGMPDTWELFYFGSLDHGPDEDYEPDGLTNIEEFEHQSDPTNPNTDGDMIDDRDEVDQGTNPAKFTYYVDDSTGSDLNDGLLPYSSGGHGPKKTIQAGINETTTSEETAVAQGTYTGPGNRDLDLNGLAITVKAMDGAAVTIIDCENSARGFYGFGIAGPGAAIDGFTITNGYTADKGGGIHCDESTMTVKNCVIRNCSSVGNGGGIFSRLSTDVKIINCLIHDNTSSGQGGGIFAAVTDITMINSTVEGNHADIMGGGIACDNNATASVTNCIFRGNTSPKGNQISLKSTAYPSTIIVEYCNVEGMQGDVNVTPRCTLDWRDGNIGSDALFVTGPIGGYYLSQTAAGQASDSPCVDAGSDTAENLGLDSSTTRTDEVADSGTVDMGYHYPVPIPEEITITSITMLDNDMTIEWDAKPGISYTVQHSTDMENWIDVPVGETGTWTDENVSDTLKFYRIFR